MVEEVPGYSDSEDSISDFEGLDEYESDEETNVSSCI